MENLNEEGNAPLFGKSFAILGVAGYIARKHLEAVRAMGGFLVAACDPHDSVGILEQYSPNTSFFTEYERFDRYLEKQKRAGHGLDYLIVCTPNYLHDAHCRLGLRVGADVICEKPLVINPWNLDQLAELEKEFKHKVNTILQLRHHPAVAELLEKCVDKQLKDKDHRFKVELSYVTPRGLWYDTSWKADEQKSGGILMNIGVHFFDLLLNLFGACLSHKLAHYTSRDAWGTLKLFSADVDWTLSINSGSVPIGQKGPFKRLVVDGEEVDLAAGFENLHINSYRHILRGYGFGVEDVRPAITLVHELREEAGVCRKR